MSAFEPCAVEIRVAIDGSVTPLRFMANGRWLPVGQIGRAWSDADGDRWLILPPALNQTLELRRAADGLWSTRAYGSSMA